MRTLIIGAGPIGTAVARQLAESGNSVRLGTRSGSGPQHPRIELVRLDARDRAQVARAADGCDVIAHCMHAPYAARAWQELLPAAERSVLAAAADSGAVVVFPESLYAFDAANLPIGETTPIVADSGKRGVRTELLRARAASGVTCRSVVASDYFGPGAGANAHAGDRMTGPVLTGTTARPLGSADQPHSFTYLPDLAAAMVRAAELPGQGHRLLFAPTAPALTQRELLAAYAEAAGRPMPRVAPLRPRLVRAVGTIHSGTRELAEMLYQFDRPFVMDSSASERELALGPTPIPRAAAQTMAALTGAGR